MKKRTSFATLLATVFLMVMPAGQGEPMLIDGKPAGKKEQEKQEERVLKGKVQQSFMSNFRIPRATANPVSTPSQPAQLFPLNAQSAGSSPLPSSTSLLEKKNTDAPKLNEGSSSASDGQKQQDPSTKQKRVVVRIRRVVALMEGEIAESAIKTALSMLKKDPESNVTIFLDLDAVSLADGQFNYPDQLSAGEDGNLRVISIKNLRAQLEKFGAEGGKIVVSERWAKVRGFARNTNTIVPGAVLTDEEGIAQLLLEATNVIDY